jgi:Tfp pilus assembly protein PilW
VEKGDIASGAVTKKKIKGDAVRSSKIKDGQVKTPDLAEEAVTTNKIAMGAVTASEIADGAVSGAKIADGAVGGAKITSDSIDHSKLADLNLFGNSVVRAPVSIQTDKDSVAAQAAAPKIPLETDRTIGSANHGAGSLQLRDLVRVSFTAISPDGAAINGLISMAAGNGIGGVYGSENGCLFSGFVIG